jgi:probable F420-dependent oxidoreductase
MKLGLATPVVVQVPGISSAWEAHAGPAEIAQVARVADELGYHHLTCAEHVAVPATQSAERGTTYWDPLATLSFLAGHTNRIRLATSVLVASYHQPLAVAKQYGTLDQLSRGRTVLGVGVGSLAEEFELLGASWADRGAATDTLLTQLRRIWGQQEVDGMVVDPHATSTRPALWVGGRTARSLRRAASLGDGWMPFGLRPQQIGTLLTAIELPPGFEVVLSPGRALDPMGAAGDTRRRLSALRAAGATAVTCAVTATSVDHHCEQLAALRTVAESVES